MKRTRQTRRTAKRLFRLCLVDGLLDEERVREIVRRVSETKNRNRFAVLSHFRHLVKLDRARHLAIIESAMPLSPNFQASVEDELLRVYGPGLNAAFKEEPALIGGMRIRVGSDVYDGSVRAKLAALEAVF